MDQGKRTKEATEGEIKQTTKIGGPFKAGPPTYQEERLALFEEIYKQQQELIAKAEHRPITITLKDGKQIQGVSFETTPLKLASDISKNLAARVMVAKVKYSNRIPLEFVQGEIVDTDKEEHTSSSSSNSEKPEIWDLNRPLEGDCTLELLNFDDPVGKETFWHSSAHLLGATLEHLYGSYLCIGPPLDNGFFYDSYMGQTKVSQGDYDKIEKAFQKLASEKQPFQRVVLTKQQALQLFKANPFKVQLISNKIPDNAITTAYKCGKLIDLCTGPHLPTTDRVKAFAVTKNSSAYWLGKNTNDDLQRVYGVAFPDKDQLKEYLRIQAELAQRDHRNVGKLNQLFLFNPLSPGSAFFYPDGTHIYNRMMTFMRSQYMIRGFSEVITPNFYNVQLWKISGHYDKYKENMFLISMGEEGDYGVKPMNCPGHCLMFDMVQHSYRDLPIRFADFGVLHRNEVHGALSGLTRVRRFQQDDAHIFCRADQLQQEITGALDFLAFIYKLFGFEYKLYLSTRPEKFLGTIEIWDNAEKQLKESLDNFGRPYEINEGDGAFYGPKIDVKLFDAYKREHQCGTIQLDFNLPERFNLQFRASEDTEEVHKEKLQVQKQQSQLAADILEIKKSESQQQEQVEEQSQQQQNTAQEGDKKKGNKKEKKPKKDSKQEEQKVGEEQTDSSLTSSEVHSILHEKKYEIGNHHLKPGFQRPIIVHRAIYGSFERFVAILTENFGGKWPFWLSPKQLAITPISKKYNDYAEKVALRFRLEGYRAMADTSDETLNKKVRNAQVEHYNFIGGVGAEEEREGTIDVRDRDKNDRIGKFTVDELILFFKGFEPENSGKFNELKQKAYYKENELAFIELDKELSTKVYLSGEGFVKGDRDEEVYAKYANTPIDKVLYPNLYRWSQFLKHHKSQQ